MLEIILLYFLCKGMGSILRDKGWNPLLMQILVVAGWIVSILFAVICYSVYVAITQGEEALNHIGFAVYLWMLLAGGITEAFLFLIAHLLPDKLASKQAPQFPPQMPR